MKRSKLNQWLADLRSGEFTQAHEILLTADKKSACCLGVYLYRTCGIEPIGAHRVVVGSGDDQTTIEVCTFESIVEPDEDSAGSSGDTSAVLPDHIWKNEGWYSDGGNRERVYGGVTFQTSKGFFGSLAAANDGGVPFTELADIIEANPLWFFKTLEEDV